MFFFFKWAFVCLSNSQLTARPPMTVYLSPKAWTSVSISQEKIGMKLLMRFCLGGSLAKFFAHVPPPLQSYCLRMKSVALTTGIKV